jgi:hypothetical protein
MQSRLPRGNGDQSVEVYTIRYVNYLLLIREKGERVEKWLTAVMAQNTDSYLLALLNGTRKGS